MRLCLKEMIPIAKKRKNGEGTLRLRKDGRWEGRIVVGYNEKSLPITKCVTAKKNRMFHKARSAERTVRTLFR